MPGGPGGRRARGQKVPHRLRMFGRHMEHFSSRTGRGLCGLAALLVAACAGIVCGMVPAGAEPAADPHLNLFGSSGLILTPTAETLPHGVYAVGVNTVDGQHRFYSGQDTVAHFVTVGLLPQVQATAVFTNHEGRFWTQYREDLGAGYGGWNFDRMFSVQGVVVRQTRRMPVSLGCGWQDMHGTGKWQARYVVATHRMPRVGLHAGIGNGFLGTVFGGIDYQATRQMRILVEHDGKRLNVGASVQLHRFTLAPVFTGASAFGGGIVYSQRL